MRLKPGDGLDLEAFATTIFDPRVAARLNGRLRRYVIICLHYPSDSDADSGPSFPSLLRPIEPFAEHGSSQTQPQLPLGRQPCRNDPDHASGIWHLTCRHLLDPHDLRP